MWGKKDRESRLSKGGIYGKKNRKPWEDKHIRFTSWWALAGVEREFPEGNLSHKLKCLCRCRKWGRAQGSALSFSLISSELQVLSSPQCFLVLGTVGGSRLQSGEGLAPTFPGTCFFQGHFPHCVPSLVVVGRLKSQELNIHATQTHVAGTVCAELDSVSCYVLHLNTAASDAFRGHQGSAAFWRLGISPA